MYKIYLKKFLAFKKNFLGIESKIKLILYNKNLYEYIFLL